MLQQKSLYYPHKKQFIFELTEKISFCFNCSSAIITDKTGKEFSTVKPLKHHIAQETSLPIFVTISDKHEPYFFFNKIGYIKIRKQIVNNMKEFCQHFKLNKKTFFLALDYVDRISSRMIAFDIEDLKQISHICLILACKFLENQSKAIEIKKLASCVSVNYAKDELYLINLLNYDLHSFTCYDILMDALNCGFLFNDEKFSLKNMHSIYREIENILYLFSESKSFIDMTHKEIALAIIGLVRETLCLVAFNKFIQIVFMNEFVDIHNYLACLNKLRKIFKFKVDNHHNNNNKNNDGHNHNNNHSDSNTDANSDNNSDNISDNNSINTSSNENKVVNNSIKNAH
jgi:hypothetical protein